MIFIRKSLDFVYTKEELRALDGMLPPFRRKKSPAIDEVLVLLNYKIHQFDNLNFQ
jgi:hypothetical protein